MEAETKLVYRKHLQGRSAAKGHTKCNPSRPPRCYQTQDIQPGLETTNTVTLSKHMGDTSTLFIHMITRAYAISKTALNGTEISNAYLLTLDIKIQYPNQGRGEVDEMMTDRRPGGGVVPLENFGFRKVGPMQNDATFDLNISSLGIPIF